MPAEAQTILRFHHLARAPPVTPRVVYVCTAGLASLRPLALGVAVPAFASPERPGCQRSPRIRLRSPRTNRTRDRCCVTADRSSRRACAATAGVCDRSTLATPTRPPTTASDSPNARAKRSRGRDAQEGRHTGEELPTGCLSDRPRSSTRCSRKGPACGRRPHLHLEGGDDQAREATELTSPE